MSIRFDLASLTKTKWYEYAVRFLFGGAVTVATGILARHYGPVVGGLFLAFPAIFPASATLAEKHQKERKQRAGIFHTIRGRQAAAVDARGAALGSLGLAGVAAIVWQLEPVLNSAATLLFAVFAWFTISDVCWHIRKRHPHLSRSSTNSSQNHRW
jgi:hypothetical protein